VSRLLDRERAALVVIDVQEAFRAALPSFAEIARHCGTLVQGARAIGLPIIVTEQYPRGLGATVPEVAAHLDPDAPVLDKLCFSAAAADGFDLGGRDQALVCGIEAHVCVSQTVHELLDRGVQVHVAADAVGSRVPLNRAVGLEKMEASGAILSSVEMALFELLRRAGSDEFKTVQQLVK